MTPEHSVPRTAAGRALLESVHAVCYHAWGECPAENRILAIEAEAAQGVRPAAYRLSAMLEEMALAGVADPFDKRDRAALERIGYHRTEADLAAAPDHNLIDTVGESTDPDRPVNDDAHWHRGPSASCPICTFGRYLLYGRDGDEGSAEP